MNSWTNSFEEYNTTLPLTEEDNLDYWCLMEKEIQAELLSYRIVNDMEDVRIAGLLFAQFGDVGGFLEDEFDKRVEVLESDLHDYGDLMKLHE